LKKILLLSICTTYIFGLEWADYKYPLKVLQHKSDMGKELEVNLSKMPVRFHKDMKMMWRLNYEKSKNMFSNMGRLHYKVDELYGTELSYLGGIDGILTLSFATNKKENINKLSRFAKNLVCNPNNGIYQTILKQGELLNISFSYASNGRNYSEYYQRNFKSQNDCKKDFDSEEGVVRKRYKN
jgi:hypothetical protein